ncbi:hypothetical protein [Aeromicrobium sp.]|uniref:hypothetical protein n=1 Tax=Aeromicrobium sp. TaxID=1871063 RepID=UPI003D6BF4C8
MTTPIRVAGFVAALAAVFAVALGIGTAVGPLGEPAGHDAGHQGEGDAAASEAADLPGGLMVSQNGYTFSLDEKVAKAGQDVPISFTIDGPDGRPVTEYDLEHEKRLHLIAVRRDFEGFQHVHPRLGADGRWDVDLDLAPGQWRLYADFKATGAEALTLGTDLTVPGDVEAAAASEETRTARIDGYTVTLDGDLTPGADAKLRLAVERDGKPVTDLQPYLGAFGHLVALREGDLAYLHVHPDGTTGNGMTEPGPEVVFYAAVPSDGTYRLYLDFKHDGVVRTAAFNVSTGGAATEDAAKSEESADGHGDH